MQRAAKRSRQMNVNPMMMHGLNPVIAGMFGMPPQMQMAGMNPMMPQMPMMMADEDDDGEEQQSTTASTRPEGSVSSEDVAASGVPNAVAPEDFHHRLPDMLISRSITFIKTIPRNRLSEVLESLSPSLDSTWCAELSMAGLLCLLLLYTRLKPNLRVSDLRHFGSNLKLNSF